MGVYGELGRKRIRLFLERLETEDKEEGEKGEIEEEEGRED